MVGGREGAAGDGEGTIRDILKNEKSRNIPFPDEQGEFNSLREGM